VDDGCTIDEARAQFADYAHVIATTRSHQKEKNGVVCDRFRVVLLLPQAVSNDSDFKRYWFAAYAKWPFIDPACKDAARFFFPCTEVVSLKEDGLLFSESIQLNAKGIQRTQVSRRQETGERGELNKKTLIFIATGKLTHGNWHNTRNAAIRDCKDNLYTMEEAMDTLHPATKKHAGDWDETDIKHFEDLYENRPSRYGPRGLDDPNNALREIILRSKYIVNMADPEETVLFDSTTGIAHALAPSVLAQVLGKAEMALYSSQSFVTAKFVYDRFKMAPMFKEASTNLTLYNTYVPPEWQRAHFYFGADLPAGSGQLPAVYDEFLTHLTDGHADSKEYILDWLTTALRGRNYTILAALGEEGIGKGILGSIMCELFGRANFAKVRDEVFKNRFNGQLRNRALVYVDEVKIETKEELNRLKDVVNDSIEVERKGKDAEQLANQASFYLSANDLDAIPLSSGDRRFSIIQLTEQKLAGTSLVHRLNPLTEPDNITQLAGYLAARTVTRNMFFPFVSARTEEVKEAGLTDWESQVLFEWTAKNVGKSINVRELQSYIRDEVFNGYRSAPGRRRIEGLCKKYPNYLRFKHKTGESERFIEVVGSPSNVGAQDSSTVPRSYSVN
jgi:hypothetical protein